MIKATIECPCDGPSVQCGFTYSAPPEGETRFNLGGQQYARRYDVCTTCHHWFSVHDLDLSNLYSGDYVDATYGHRMSATFERIISLPAYKSDNAGRCDRIEAFASGVFPWAMKEAGWTCTALDPDPRACAHIEMRVGVRTIQAEFLGVEPAHVGVFDVVTFNKVLEHVENPCQMLAHARRFLREGGFCYVEVPDADGAAELGPHREEFFVEHHHVFSASSICATVERSGFRVLRLERVADPSGKFTLACYAVPKLAHL